ncbi:FadR/GntR family transcriptional regulator, partial [Pseudomonas sp. 2822-17]|uniref:FadR/GntR family transcriptional regulator n=1 Tax=Pseudomonas sp. 2822-17 TaxID=1712678 RepID=UPI00117B4CD7
AGFFLRDSKARQDVKETRKIIEVEAVRLACSRMTNDQLKELETFIQQSKEQWAEGKLPVDEDYLFHHTLVASSHNRLLLNIWRPLVSYNKVAI